MFICSHLKSCSNYVAISFADSMVNKTCNKVHVGAFQFHGMTVPSEPEPPHFGSFAITLRPTTLGRAPVCRSFTGRRDIYLTTHSNHKRQASMPPAGFKPAIHARERPQTHTLDRVATGTAHTWLRANKQLQTTEFTGYIRFWQMYITFKIISFMDLFHLKHQVVDRFHDAYNLKVFTCFRILEVGKV
jgi:hypothetical protein